MNAGMAVAVVRELKEGNVRRAVVNLWVGLLFLVPLGASAQEGYDVDFDKYSVTTEQMVLLKGTITSDLPGDALAKAYGEMALERFNRTITSADPNSAEIMSWCDLAVQGTQVRRDQTDEYGQAQLTLKAKVERCSQVYMHDLNANHSCKVATDKKGNKTLVCSVTVGLAFQRFKFDAVSGKWVGDSSFGDKGFTRMSASSDSSISLEKIDMATAEKSAIGSASVSAGTSLKRKIRDVSEFQQRTPIIGVKKGNAYSCLGKDTVELDLPFFVVIDKGGKEAQKGFVKARVIKDGCVETPELKNRMSNGYRAVIKPMESQIILGGKGVKPGMSLREMPTAGASMGASLGVTNSFGGVGDGSFRIWPALTINVDQNLAPKTGISEFFTWQALRITGVFGDDALGRVKSKMGSALGLVNSNGNPDIGSNYMLVIQLDVGIHKRFFFGPFLMGFGVGAGFSANVFENIKNLNNDDVTPMIFGVGGMGQIEIGGQLTPRLLMSIMLGYRLEYGFTFLFKDGEDVSIRNDPFGLAHGVVANLQFMYTL